MEDLGLVCYKLSLSPFVNGLLFGNCQLKSKNLKLVTIQILQTRSLDYLYQNDHKNPVK